jgi:hypothetical protein
MFSKQFTYASTDIATYTDTIHVLSEERAKRLTDLRITQTPTDAGMRAYYNNQRAIWLAEVESYNRDIRSAQAVLDRMLRKIGKETEG